MSCSSTSTPTSPRSTSIVYTNARAGRASLEQGNRGAPTSPPPRPGPGADPGPSYDPDAPLRAHVASLDASPLVAGRLALCRVRNGTIRSGQRIAWCRASGEIEPAAVSELYVTEALDRVEAEEAGQARSSPSPAFEVTIGETLADPGDPRPLPVITVDEPSLSITVGISTSPLAGKDRSKLTARQIRDRLDQELVGNVSIGFARSSGPTPGRSRAGGAPAGRPPGDDAARGIRADRRPAACLTREMDGKLCEPVERLAIDVPEDFVGVVTQALAVRKARMEQMVNHQTGWVGSSTWCRRGS